MTVIAEQSVQRTDQGHSRGVADESLVYTATRALTPDPQRLLEHRVILAMPPGPAVNAYKVLRTQVRRRMRSNHWVTLGVTSPMQGNGKTLTALNLAITLARDANQTVLLVDLDLRRPRIAHYLTEESLPGMADYLAGLHDLPELLIHIGLERLVILPAGAPLLDSSEQLSSPRMARLVTELRERYPDRIVLFDLPPLLISDDVIAFTPNLDTVMLVVEEGKTTQEELKRAYELLDEHHIMGVVFNKSVYNAKLPGYGSDVYY